MVNRIYFNGGPDDVRMVLGRFVAALTGKSNEYSKDASAVHTVVGFAALSDIKDDFVRKARGQVGEDGVKWAPLSPKTLAYGRKAPKGRGHAPGGKDGLLTKAQLKRWRQIYGSTLARLAVKEGVTASTKGIAAGHAWNVIKAEGGKTKLSEYANRPHEILRDTGVLLNSLSPGQMGGDEANLIYTPPSGDGGAEQIFELRKDGVIIGTNVPYAKTHQEGDKKRNIPARPFIPNRVPDAWAEGWLRAGTSAVFSGIRRALEAFAA